MLYLNEFLFHALVLGRGIFTEQPSSPSHIILTIGCIGFKILIRKKKDLKILVSNDIQAKILFNQDFQLG
jgi:hypothetical protein